MELLRQVGVIPFLQNCQFFQAKIEQLASILIAGLLAAVLKILIAVRTVFCFTDSP